MEVENKIHHNIPQLLYYLVQAKVSVLIWGRATGKTSGPLADFSMENVTKMPRSNGAFYCNTYTDVLTKVLPAVVQGWEKFGYKEELHFFVGKFAPAKYKWEKAFRYPRDAKHYIHWVNGSGIFLVSGDRSTSNGFSLDWAGIDEARLQKRDKLKEFLLTIRGNAEHFGHLSNHGSVLYLSDMPRSATEKWLLEFKDLMDEETINLIIAVQCKIMQLDELLLKETSDENKKVIERQIASFLRKINLLRKDAVYFSMASTLDNIHSIGLDPIVNFRRQLSDYEFLISVLNKQIEGVLNGFYALMDEEFHGYYAENYSHIDDLELEITRKPVSRNCLWDADVDLNRPLDLSADYNNKINSCVVGQVSDDANEYRVLNALFVKAPEYLKELATKFCDYYEHHRTKEVRYFYDNTAIGGNAKGDISFQEEWTRVLVSRGWRVNHQYIGQAPRHHDRYLLWQMTLAEKDPRLLRFRFNRTNCNDMYISCKAAEVKKDRDSFKKDKSSERPDSGVPPEHATHLSEALDILIYGVNRPNLEESTPFVDNMVG